VNVEEINQLRDGLYELIALPHPVPHVDAAGSTRATLHGTVPPQLKMTKKGFVGAAIKNGGAAAVTVT
jgi:hypothetical protein